MRKNLILGLIIMILFNLISCERYDDAILIIKVINRADSTSIYNVKIDVVKRKPAMIWGYKSVDNYQGRTNKQGICSLYIDNYNKDKYDYSIDVNNYEDTPPDFGGYTYSVWGTVLEKYELDDTLKVRLTRITFPGIQEE